METIDRRERTPGVTTTSWEELADSHARALDQLADLVRGVDPGQPIPSLGWDVRELLAHLIGTARRYASDDASAMASSPAGVKELNDSDVAALSGAAKVQDLLADLEDAQRRLTSSWTGRDLSDPLPFHAGVTLSAAGAAGEWLGELLVHGWDLARAARRRWTIQERDALLVAVFIFEVLPAYTDTTKITRPLAVEIRLRHGRPQVVTANATTVEVIAPSLQLPIDSVIRSPSVPWLLNGYGRMPLAAAVLKGMLITGGRRPWRGLELQRATIRP